MPAAISGATDVQDINCWVANGKDEVHENLLMLYELVKSSSHYIAVIKTIVWPGCSAPDPPRFLCYRLYSLYPRRWKSTHTYKRVYDSDVTQVFHCQDVTTQ